MWEEKQGKSLGEKPSNGVRKKGAKGEMGGGLSLSKTEGEERKLYEAPGGGRGIHKRLKDCRRGSRTCFPKDNTPTENEGLITGQLAGGKNDSG